MPIVRLENPCWETYCDNCGEGTNFESPGSYHHSSEMEAIADAESMGWKVAALAARDNQGRVRVIYCESCWENMQEPSLIQAHRPYDQEAQEA